MGDVITFAAPALMLGFLYCLYRAGTMWSGWRPAAAVVWSTDYTEDQQWDDRWGLGLVRGWRFGDGDHQRLIEEVVHYQDEDGNRHTAELKRYVQQGRQPDGAHVIWYDTANPEKVSASGPGSWLLCAAAVAAMLIGLINLGMQLHH
jgi:hypothetical protein